jgi:hypothetical protein
MAEMTRSLEISENYLVYNVLPVIHKCNQASVRYLGYASNSHLPPNHVQHQR